MDEHDNAEFRAHIRSKAQASRCLSLVAGAIVLASATACSDLDDASDTFCDLEPGVGVCGVEDVEVNPLTDPWWCLDRTPAPLPLPQNRVVAFVLPVVDWSTRRSMAGNGLTATLCPGQDFACPAPLAPPYVVENGTLAGTPIPEPASGIPVPEGFDGFIRFDVMTPPGTPEAEQYLPEAYYLGGQISGTVTQGGPILMLTRGLMETLTRQSFLGVDPTSSSDLGVLAFGVYDCNGDFVRGGARIEINVGGGTPAGALPFQLPGSRIPIATPANQPLLTDATSGLAGYINVPSGTVQLEAYRTDVESDVLIGRIQIGSVPGQLSVGSIRPSYVLDANLRGAPPLELTMDNEDAVGNQQ